MGGSRAQSPIKSFTQLVLQTTIVRSDVEVSVGDWSAGRMSGVVSYVRKFCKKCPEKGRIR